MKEEILQVAIGRSIGVLVLKGLNVKYMIMKKYNENSFQKKAIYR